MDEYNMYTNSASVIKHKLMHILSGLAATGFLSEGIQWHTVKPQIWGTQNSKT